MNLARVFNPPLNFPPKYGLRDMTSPENVGASIVPVSICCVLYLIATDTSSMRWTALRQSELLQYYRRVAAVPQLFSSPHLMAVLGIDTSEQRSAVMEALERES